MTVTYTWQILRMECFPNYNGQTDVVCTIFWRYTGTDGNYSANLDGSVNVNYLAGQPFTPYNDLTQDQVIAWVIERLGSQNITSYQGTLANEIQTQQAVPVVIPPLPWSN